MQPLVVEEGGRLEGCFGVRAIWVLVLAHLVLEWPRWLLCGEGP